MLVSTAEILAEKSVVHDSIYNILQFLVQEFSFSSTPLLLGELIHSDSVSPPPPNPTEFQMIFQGSRLILLWNTVITRK